MLRHEASVRIKRQVSLASLAVEYCDQRGVLLVNPRAHEFDNRYVMSWLRPSAEAVYENDTENRAFGFDEVEAHAREMYDEFSRKTLADLAIAAQKPISVFRPVRQLTRMPR